MTFQLDPAAALAAPKTGVGASGAGRRFRLRAATDEAHRHVEAILARGRAFESVGRYQRYLEASLDARAAIEAELAGAIASGRLPPEAHHPVAALIVDDLRDIGGDPGREIRARRYGLPGDGAELLGKLYVLEGSSLGARLIVGYAANLGLSAGHGARNLHAQANERQAWRRTCALLDETDLDAGGEARMIAAANQVFSAFASAYARRLG